MITTAELYRLDASGRKRYKRVPAGKEVGARLSSLCTDAVLWMEDDGSVHISVARGNATLLSWDLDADPPGAAERALKQRAARKTAVKHIVETLGK